MDRGLLAVPLPQAMATAALNHLPGLSQWMHITPAAVITITITITIIFIKNARAVRTSMR
jgi:hypothetical protein